MSSPQYPATARPTAPRLAPAPPVRPAPSPPRRARAPPRIPPRTPRTPSGPTEAHAQAQTQAQAQRPAEAQTKAQGQPQGKAPAPAQAQARPDAPSNAKDKPAAPTYAKGKPARGKLAAKMGAIKGKMRGKPKPSELELRMQKGYTVVSDAFSKVIRYCGSPLKFGITLFLTYYLAHLIFRIWRIPYHLTPVVPPALAAAIGFALRDANGPAIASKCLKATHGNDIIYEPLYHIVHALHTKQIWLAVSALEIIYVGHVRPAALVALIPWQFMYTSTIGF